MYLRLSYVFVLYILQLQFNSGISSKYFIFGSGIPIEVLRCFILSKLHPIRPLKQFWENTCTFLSNFWRNKNQKIWVDSNTTSMSIFEPYKPIFKVGVEGGGVNPKNLKYSKKFENCFRGFRKAKSLFFHTFFSNFLRPTLTPFPLHWLCILRIHIHFLIFRSLTSFSLKWGLCYYIRICIDKRRYELPSKSFEGRIIVVK